MSLNFYENQITGLLGHNGAGKVNFFFTFSKFKIFKVILKSNFQRQQQHVCFVVIICRYLIFDIA